MNWALGRAVVYVLFSLAGCSQPSTPPVKTAAGRDAVAPPSGTNQVVKKGSKAVTLHDQTFATLAAAAHGRAIVVARCENAVIRFPKSRSEHVLLDLKVSETGLGKPPNPWQIRAYTQGDPIMKKGTTYLVAAMEEVPGDWVLVECAPVTPEEAATSLRAAVERAERK